jgi:hypothetical protein
MMPAFLRFGVVSAQSLTAAGFDQLLTHWKHPPIRSLGGTGFQPVVSGILPETGEAGVLGTGVDSDLRAGPQPSLAGSQTQPPGSRFHPGQAGAESPQKLRAHNDHGESLGGNALFPFTKFCTASNRIPRIRGTGSHSATVWSGNGLPTGFPNLLPS